MDWKRENQRPEVYICQDRRNDRRTVLIWKHAQNKKNIHLKEEVASKQPTRTARAEDSAFLIRTRAQSCGIPLFGPFPSSPSSSFLVFSSSSSPSSLPSLSSTTGSSKYHHHFVSSFRAVNRPGPLSKTPSSEALPSLLRLIAYAAQHLTLSSPDCQYRLLVPYISQRAHRLAARDLEEDR